MPTKQPKKIKTPKLTTPKELEVDAVGPATPEALDVVKEARRLGRTRTQTARTYAALLHGFEAMNDEEKQAFVDHLVDEITAGRVHEDELPTELVAALTAFVQARTEAPLPARSRDSHARLLWTARDALVVARENAIVEGLPAFALFGFLFDLGDPLVPAAFAGSPAARDAVRQARGQRALLVGIETRDKLLPLLTPLGYRIAGLAPPLLLSNDYEDPPLIKVLRSWNDTTLLPVIVIAQAQVSVQGLPVSSLVRGDAAIPAA